MVDRSTVWQPDRQGSDRRTQSQPIVGSISGATQLSARRRTADCDDDDNDDDGDDGVDDDDDDDGDEEDDDDDNGVDGDDEDGDGDGDNSSLHADDDDEGGSGGSEEERGEGCGGNQAGQDWEADQSKRMDQSKRTGNNILCGFTIPSSCPICDILQVLFHTTFIPFVCPESCCSLLFHLLTHPFGKNIYRELSVFYSSLSEFLWFLLLV